MRAAREGLEVVALTGRARAGMFEFARVLGLESWICELGGIRIYDRGETVVHEHGAFPGGGVPTAELHRAVDLLLEAYPGRLEEHSPWNATRESSFLLRGEVATAEAEERLAAAGLGPGAGLGSRGHQGRPRRGIRRGRGPPPRRELSAVAKGAQRPSRSIGLGSMQWSCLR